MASCSVESRCTQHDCGVYLVPSLCLLQQHNLSRAGDANGLPEQLGVEGLWDLAAHVSRHIANEGLSTGA